MDDDLMVKQFIQMLKGMAFDKYNDLDPEFINNS